ncbi:MAG: DUF1801 domain-containing protein [Deltaproteobacteria bacterium]|nr:DUF1801 domain-containing protein [Deltaproteobacteria bacterium]
MKPGLASVDAYIRSFPAATQRMLRQLRAIIRAAAPGATEKLSYRMPAFSLDGPLVYYAAYEHHVGLYGAVSALGALGREAAAYRTSKGTLRFALDAPLPADLILRLVKHRVRENQAKAQRRKKPAG